AAQICGTVRLRPAVCDQQPLPPAERGLAPIICAERRWRTIHHPVTADHSGALLRTGHTYNDDDAGYDHGPDNRLAEEDRCQQKSEEGLEKLQLADAGDATERKAPIPDY